MLALSIGLRNPRCNSISNFILNLSQSFRLCGSWSVKVDAMATISAINIACLHLGLLRRILYFPHASPLPRIFTSICKENVFTCDVKSPIELIGQLRMVCRELVSKYSLAIVRPECKRNLPRSRWKLIIRSLVESKLCTVLVGPLTISFVCIDFSVLQIFIVILIIRDTVVYSEFLDCL